MCISFFGEGGSASVCGYLTYYKMDLNNKKRVKVQQESLQNNAEREPEYVLSDFSFAVQTDIAVLGCANYISSSACSIDFKRVKTKQKTLKIAPLLLFRIITEAAVKPSFYALLSLCRPLNRSGVNQLALGRSHKAPDSK